MPQPDSKPAPAAYEKLPAVLGLFSAVALVIGQVIGSGIFLKPNVIAQSTGGYVGLILALWALCGLINLCGALAMAELAAMLPHTGGTYVFLREAYGRMWSFVWCWAEFWVIRSGAIATLGTAMAISLTKFLAYDEDDSRTLIKLVAISAILFLAVINILGTRFGGAVQNVTTVIKAGSLLFLGLLPFFALGERTSPDISWLPRTMETGLVAGIGAALAGIMWAYDGWGHVTVVAEEIRNPQKNIPRALTLGVVILVVLYLGANLAYHFTLSSSEIAAADVPAEAVTRRLLGDFGGRLVLGLLLVSAFGAMSSNILVGPRVLVAAGRDVELFRAWRRLDPRFGTPAIAIATECAWSVGLILLGDLSPNPNKRLFDVLSDYTVFGGSLFYLAAVLAVFVLRYHPRWAAAPRPYRAWGYPWVPGAFVLFYVGFLVSMVRAAPQQCLSGLGLIAAGVVFYLLFVSPPRRPAEAREPVAPPA